MAAGEASPAVPTEAPASEAEEAFTRATVMAEAFAGEVGGGKFDSPIKGAVKWGAGHIESLLELITDNTRALGFLLLIVGLAMIFFTLTYITKNMKKLMANRAERALNAALEKSGLIGIAVEGGDDHEADRVVGPRRPSPSVRGGFAWAPILWFVAGASVAASTAFV